MGAGVSVGASVGIGVRVGVAWGVGVGTKSSADGARMEREVRGIGKEAGVGNLVGSVRGVGESITMLWLATAGLEAGTGVSGSLQAISRPAASKETRTARPAMRKRAFENKASFYCS